MRAKIMDLLAFFALPRRIKIRFLDADYFSRRVKIGVTAIPTSQVARCPQFFPAGFAFSAARRRLRGLEAPTPLPRPARQLHPMMPWHQEATGQN
jgi:hypothetical protein